MARNRRQWLCGVSLCLAVALLGGCRCEDRGDKAAKPDVSFCDKQSQWDQWEAEVKKFSADDRMMELHALRLGICSMIYTGQIEPERGIRLFEKAHFAWLERIVGLQRQKATHKPKKKPAKKPPAENLQQDGR